MSTIYALLSVFVVSLISLIGVLTLSLSIEKLKKYLFVLVSFAVGGLYGDAFLHLIPESLEQLGDIEMVAVWVLIGLGIFFILEKFIYWTHEHEADHSNHIHPLGYLNIISDGFRNFFDGVVVAVSYLVSPIVGLTTTLAVILHEIPQEISDFGILIHSGLSKWKALLWNFISGCLAILGALVVIFIGSENWGLEVISRYILPITAGGFIYIAGSDLVPTLNYKNKLRESGAQFLAVFLGVSLMFLLTWLE